MNFGFLGAGNLGFVGLLCSGGYERLLGFVRVKETRFFAVGFADLILACAGCHAEEAYVATVSMGALHGVRSGKVCRTVECYVVAFSRENLVSESEDFVICDLLD